MIEPGAGQRDRPVLRIGSAVIGGTASVLATVLSHQTPALVPGYLVMWTILGLLAVVFSSETFGPRSGLRGGHFQRFRIPGPADRPPA